MGAVALSACQNDATTDTAATDAQTAPMADDAPATDAATPTGDYAAEAPAMDTAASGTLVEVASGSPDHTTVVTAVQAAGLVDTLNGAGPFTVFAPTNAAFDKLPAGTVDGLLKPEAKDDLSGVLTYHVVSGNVDAATLTQQITDGGGSATLTTVQGGTLTARADGGNVTLTDAKGNTATVTTADLKGSNGVIHVIDTVLMP
ncbi:fasciclin domain-containing protein [Luteimonas rhizosphaericola]